MTTVVTTRTPAPPAAVWSVLADLDRWAETLPTVTAIRRVSAEGPPLGAAYRIEQPRLRPALWTVTEWTPGTSFTWTSRQVGVTSTATHVVHATPDGGSEITLTMTWTGLLAALVRRLYGGLTREYMEAEAAAIVDRAGTTG